MKNTTYIYELSIDDIPFYIGKTVSPLSRKTSHKTKYGENIELTVIDEVNSVKKQYWKPLEIFWITQYKQWGFELVNKNDGGNGIECWSEEMKLQRSIKYKQKPPHPKNHTMETKLKISLANKNKKLGPRNNEIKTKISKGNSKPVLQYDLQGNFVKEYFSIKEAGVSVNTNPNNITSCLVGITKKSKGYIWKYKQLN